VARVPRNNTAAGLVRTATQVTPDQMAELARLADERQLSVAAVIREAIRNYLTETKRQQQEALAA
jgi:predicted transcriptional regulator